MSEREISLSSQNNYVLYFLSDYCNIQIKLYIYNTLLKSDTWKSFQQNDISRCPCVRQWLLIWTQWLFKWTLIFFCVKLHCISGHSILRVEVSLFSRWTNRVVSCKIKRGPLLAIKYDHNHRRQQKRARKKARGREEGGGGGGEGHQPVVISWWIFHYRAEMTAMHASWQLSPECARASRSREREREESHPNFTPSGYWTLRNCKTRALSLVGLAWTRAVDSVSGDAARLDVMHAPRRDGTRHLCHPIRQDSRFSIARSGSRRCTTTLCTDEKEMSGILYNCAIARSNN